MSISHHVYGNNGAGGPVDFTTPLATVAAPPWLSPAMALGSRNRFAVRPFDTVTGYESPVQVYLEIDLDAAGADLSARPSPPTHIHAEQLAAGTVRIFWSYNPLVGPKADRFDVWATVGGTVNYAAAPAATVSLAGLAPGSLTCLYWADLPGLTPGTAYAVGVRAHNAAGYELNTLSISVTPDNAAPDPVDVIAATVGF